jgi:hypothetical protein
MKIFNIVFTLIFLSFAYLQFNDPDPLLWILIYGTMALMCGLAAANLYPKRVYLVLLVLFVGFSTIYIPSVLVWMQQDDLTALFDEIAKMEHLYIEESREFLGLMICVAVLVVNYIQARRLSKGW